MAEHEPEPITCQECGEPVDVDDRDTLDAAGDYFCNERCYDATRERIRDEMAELKREG